MGALSLTVPLAKAGADGDHEVGGKAAKLSRLITAGYRVPDGFCITTEAYRRFVEFGGLERQIDMETARKPMASMRWEEIWDAALRLRTAFLRSPMPNDVVNAILAEYGNMKAEQVAVRSSAVGEDSLERSYAGLHDSVVGVEGEDALLDSVRLVWASLWSDAALLYRQELQLEARESAMAVVVQELVSMDRSGVSFGRDPREPTADRQVIEAVPGLCQDLVDGAVDPDRWLVRRSNGEIIEWLPGARPDKAQKPLLADKDIDLIHDTLNTIEQAFGWPPDIEWTGRGSDFTVLQARPVTMASPSAKEDKREWYLSLRPGREKLAALCKRVTEELIPALEAEGHRLAEEGIEAYTDEALAKALDDRLEIHARWKDIYWDEFIPFAHGVRQLGTYYNDAVKPEDPYEFVQILRSQPMIASERNEALSELAASVRNNARLLALFQQVASSGSAADEPGWADVEEMVGDVDGGPELLDKVRSLSGQYLDIAFQGEQLDTRPDLVLHTVVEMAVAGSPRPKEDSASETIHREHEERLFAAVGSERRQEAESVMEIARLSWKLRDDDNVLMGRVEKQLLRAIEVAGDRLEDAGRLLPGVQVTAESAPALVAALLDSNAGHVKLEVPKEKESSVGIVSEGEKPRQVVGQPAAPGLATAKARVVRTTDDLGKFKAGEVLVCDAIQPTMSHIVPLAAAIVERRGGMLIHGAIIAREMGVPCVNGVSDAILSIDNGEIVTVDGHLGIVTIGPPEFDLEVPDL